MKKIEPDKWKHFYVGILMGIMLQAFSWWLIRDHPVIATVVAFVVVVSISYGFELFSKVTGKGHYEVMDAVAAVVGGVIGMGVTLFVQII